jgi:hypothetical protein
MADQSGIAWFVELVGRGIEICSVEPGTLSQIKVKLCGILDSPRDDLQEF